jgi:malic enzyme
LYENIIPTPYYTSKILVFPTLEDFWTYTEINMLYSTTICKDNQRTLAILLILTTHYSQGTGAVTLAAVMAAIGVTKTTLADQRFVIYGAGSAGLGIACQLRDAIIKSHPEISLEQASKQFWLIDKFGLVWKGLRDEKVRRDVREFKRLEDEWQQAEKGEGNKGIELLEVVKRVKPTVLIGCSTHAGAFTREVVETMAKGCAYSGS